MSMKTTGVWIATVVAAGAIGWFAAMEVVRGPALKDEQDAYERFSNAFTMTDSLERIEVVDRLVRRLTPETLPGAVRALEDAQQDIFNYDLSMVMYYWAKQDPRGMLAKVQGWPEMRVQRIAAGEAVYWVLKTEGYDAARKLFDELPTHQRYAALPLLVLAYLESGQTINLVQLIDTYLESEERSFTTGIVVGQILAHNGPEALERWVDSLPEGPGSSSDVKVVAFEAAQSELMRRDQFEFLEGWLDRVEGKAFAKSGGRRTVGIHLAKRDPQRAIAYARGLPPEKGRDKVISDTLRAYATYDRDGALRWMRTEKPDRTLDAGAARLAYEFALRDPQAAAEMLARIQDPAVFAQAEKLLITHWRALDDELEKALNDRVAEIPRPVGAPAEPAEGAPAAEASGAAKS